MANVYAIGFPNGKLYIGLTDGTAAHRLSEHIAHARCGSALFVHKAVRKYGRNVKLMLLVQGITFAEAKDLEVWWISRLGTFGFGGYNLTSGGEGPSSVDMKNRWQDPVFRAKTIKGMKAAKREYSTEFIERSTAQLVKYSRTKENRAKMKKKMKQYWAGKREQS